MPIFFGHPPADAIRAALTGTVSISVGGPSASYSFGRDTAGYSAADHKPYFVEVTGTEGRVWLEDMAGLPNSDWDYNDRSWRVSVRALDATLGGGSVVTLSYPQPVASLEAFWYPAMAEGPDQMRLRETVTQVSADEYRWDLEFANTSTDSGSPTTFYHLGAAEFELSILDLDAITRHETPPPGWSVVEITGPGTGEVVRWETGSDFIMPGQSRTFTFYTAPLEVVWVPGIAGTPDDPSAGSADAVGAGLAPGELPRVIIADSLGNEVPSDPGLKVAKWQNAFTVDATDNVVVKGPDAGTNWDFIDRDPDRFNVWVQDPTKYNAMEADGKTPKFPTVDVTLATVNAPFFEQHNDPATTLRLVRHQTKAGWYWSDSQMMVSNEVDDKYSAAYLGADESPPGANTNHKEDHDFPVTDRTHRVALGGTVTAKYEFVPGAFVTDDAPVNVKKNVKLNITILREAAGKLPVILQDYVFEDIRRMQEIYAQVGIAIPFEFVAIKTVDPPTAPAPGVDLTLPQGLEESSKVVGGILQMTDEEKALLGATDPRLRTTTAESGGKDDIEVYYVNQLSLGSKGRSYWAAGVPDQYEDSAILDDIRRYTTLAHEAGHVLSNDPSHYQVPVPLHPALNSINLMADLPESVFSGEVIDSRRLTVAQEAAMLASPNLLFDP